MLVFRIKTIKMKNFNFQKKPSYKWESIDVVYILLNKLQYVTPHIPYPIVTMIMELKLFQARRQVSDIGAANWI